MKYTDKTKVTEAEYLQLVGLLVLSKRHNEKLTDIRDAVMQITGETDDCGHSSDAVYGDHNADELLAKLGIEVVASHNTEVQAAPRSGVGLNELLAGAPQIRRETDVCHTKPI